MTLTKHAREQMEHRCISPKRLERALRRGTEVWRNGVIHIPHGRLRLIVDPYRGCVITAYWHGPLPVDVCKRRRKK